MVIVGDRFPTYARAPTRQIRRAHLRRDMAAMIDRAASGEGVGASLRHSSGMVFARWKRPGAGSIGRLTPRPYVGWLRPVVRPPLKAWVTGACPWSASVYRKLPTIEPAVGTFAGAEGVPPHNNASERALRHGASWCTTSHGTDREAGSCYVEEILRVVVATRRQRGRDVLGFLGECFLARFAGRTAPTRLA